MDEIVRVNQGNLIPESFQEAQYLKTESTWKQMAHLTVDHAISQWIQALRGHTRETYICGMKRLTELGLINPTDTLQKFSLINHNTIIDRIKLVEGWSESTRQARAACYISFTRWLSRLSEGIIPRGEPSREGTNKTFYKVRDKVATEAMSKSQWFVFFDELKKLNPRDALIGKVALQGGKRISEVLSLTLDRVDHSKRKIRFQHSKTKGLLKESLITYSSDVWEHFEEYLRGRNRGLVFITSNGKQVQRMQLNRTFLSAGKSAGIPFRVTPHVLRASCVTYLKALGISDSDIMAVTGHARPEMVHAYDKRDNENNVSQEVKLI